MESPVDLTNFAMEFDRIFTWSRPVRGLPLFFRYVLASAVVAVFFAIRSATEDTLGHYPFLLFIPAIIGISLVLDRGTGFFAVVLSAALAWYFFIPPSGSFSLKGPGEGAALVLYVIVGFFLASVVESLRATAARLQTTKIQLERSDALNRLLPSAQAVPLGLITNKLIENSLKHAFPNDRRGEIHVRFERCGDRCRLTVADDGIGASEQGPPGGGARLMRSLAQQLGGALDFRGPPGVGVQASLLFPLTPPDA